MRLNSISKDAGGWLADPEAVERGGLCRGWRTSCLRTRDVGSAHEGLRLRILLECGNFTIVRNGTRLKCDTCNGTTSA